MSIEACLLANEGSCNAIRVLGSVQPSHVGG